MNVNRLATNWQKYWLMNGIDEKLSYYVYEAFLQIVNNWRLIGLALEIDYTTCENKKGKPRLFESTFTSWKTKEHPHNRDTVLKHSSKDILDAKGVASKLQR